MHKLPQAFHGKRGLLIHSRQRLDAQDAHFGRERVSRLTEYGSSRKRIGLIIRRLELRHQDQHCYRADEA